MTDTPFRGVGSPDPYNGVSDWTLWTNHQTVMRHDKWLDEMGIPQLSVQERAAFRPILQAAYRQQVAHGKRLNLLTFAVSVSAVINGIATLYMALHR